ncbi:MAG: succinyl-diaminopimelate desuccinylase [Parvularculaceae bacterium]|nr:succinyl-diaminopimelate desuccinylase [Parvularculaceae bacterium]
MLCAKAKDGRKTGRTTAVQAGAFGYKAGMALLDPIELARALIKRPSVTPNDAGALDLVEAACRTLGFETRRLRFSAPGQADVDNLFARRGRSGPVLGYAGHTDVVPPGQSASWKHDPFGAVLEDGRLWGRGAADMKGGIAAFLAGVERAIVENLVTGSLVLLITGDEEGPAVNGTRKMLDWMRENGESLDHCLVGEPTSAETLGDMIKVGRRGSLNATLTVRGKQGHVGYPDRARNAVHALAAIVADLAGTPLDDGYDRFQPSGLQVTDIHVGNPAGNVIPGEAAARFNVRFNPNWTGRSLEARLQERVAALAASHGVAVTLECVVSGESFLTRDDGFISLVSEAIRGVAGVTPERSTTGGTSDARFIKDVAPVVEFGLVGATIHQIDEHVVAADIERLAEIYRAVIARYFARERSA